ncbi:SRPBCC family protein [Streptomyces sp. SID5910]|uniref:SRPBCC family protein n=1 Tax=Streptomyces sp. SID5910 TaxID=2690312 RepID=UPI00136D7A89|nr:SRPBCC family protein [Streptomyces sp. SID5910]MYR46029.1 polyketide cyclase /reductase [Streptomyces sp. SID5910]
MSGTRKITLRGALLASALLAATAAPAAAAPSDPARPLTCRGEGVDPDARVRHRTETLIHAPLRTVWRLQTDVERWPAWQPPVESAERLDHGPLRQGSAFRWTTPLPPNPATDATSLDITSTVQQLRHGSCIRWTGPAVADGLHIDGVHVWTFTEVRGGVLVRTEETHTGEQVDADVPVATEILATGLEGWLRDLKTAAEDRCRASAARA